MPANDRCKLTGSFGKYVKSHLIPKALTRLGMSEEPFMQGGMGTRPSTRRDSWYDRQLTIRKGEIILAALDDWAIKALRSHELVWSGWEGPSLKDCNAPEIIPGTCNGIRRIVGIDPQKIRLFLMSLLWRAAASNRFEFSQVKMPDQDLERLRCFILTGDPGPLDFYPAQIIQLHTKGELHNLTPVLIKKTIPAFEGNPEIEIPAFRFYMDGLIIHFHCHASNVRQEEHQDFLNAGYGDEIIVVTIPYDSSFEKENLQKLKLQFFLDKQDPLKS